MKKKLLTVLMLAGILISASCTKDDVVEPTLQLSETGTITLPKAASEKAVTVTTNQAEWTSMANANWIELIQSGNTLTIKAGENFTSEKRKAEVMVLAGGLGKKLAVEQSESEFTIVTIPDKLEVTQWGGTFQFDVDANSDNWNVTSNAEWLKVTPKQFKKEVVLEIEENTVRESRTAVLTITGEGNASMKEFTVVQQGIMYYILPYLQVETSLGGIIAFENARMSTYVPDFNAIIYDEHTFETLSPVFPTIVYMNYNNLTSQVNMYASSNEFIKDPEFATMMTEDGYELTSENLYTKKSSQGESTYIIEAEMVDGGEDDISGIIFTFRPEQPGPMPTFEEMPYSFMKFGEPDGTKENIFDWEEKNGGVYDEENSNVSTGYYRFNAPLPWSIRAYISSSTPYLVQTSSIFEDISKFYYKAGGKYYMTEEFTALKDKEGFTDYLGASTSGLSFYGSPDSPYELAVGVMSYYDVMDGKEIVDLRFDLADKSGGSIQGKFHKNRISKDNSTKVLSSKKINIEK